MENQKLGRQTFQPGSPPVIIGHGSAAGHKESSGPLGGHFDHTSQDDTFGCKTWEQAESAMQGLALDAALKRAGLHTPDLDLLLAGDLLNQCIGAGYAARSVDVPFFGLYGACSTMGESLALATLLLSGGYGKYAAAVTSSHFCSAERQYRTPLEYGSQRTPTAQWTATAAGAVVVTSAARPGPKVVRVTVGRVKDKGITDANNMGAAMAPADARLTQYISNRWYDCVTHPPSQKCRAEKARMGISINSSPAQSGGGGRSLAGRLPPYCFPGGLPMSKEAMVVVGYARVSTENQIENYSIEEQTGRLRAYCAAKGWGLRGIYIDGGYSGGNTNRPALREMLSAVRGGGVDAVVVYKLDRLSRSQKDTLTLIEDELLAHGTDFVSINENFDTSTPFGRAMIGILSVFAQLEKDQITERFTMGRIGRSKAGYYHGGSRPPTGYDYRDGLLVVDEYEAIQIRELFARFLAGKSVNSISRYLSARYTTKWSPGKVLNALRNTVYIGKVHFRKVDYDGLHQPLVSVEEFQAAARLLDGASGRERAKTSAQKNPFRAGFLLSGLVWCGRCGARYSANHGYYKCYSRSKASRKYIRDPDCKNDNWEIGSLDGLVQREIHRMISRPELLGAVIRAADRREVPIDRPALQKRIAELDGQIAKLVELYQVGSIPMETITRRIDAISTERAQLQERLDTPDPVPVGDCLREAMEDYQAGFDTGDTDNRRMFTASLVERVVIDGRSVEIRWRL